MSVSLTKARTLVVDDFQGMRTILRDIVRAMGVTHVDTAANGREALNLLRGSRYDVVICDFNLGPGLNGQQVLDEARLHDYIGVSTIWVMVTAEKTAEMVMGAAEVKPDEYLLKPINQSILESRLERLIVKKQALRGIEEAIKAKDYAAAIGAGMSPLVASYGFEDYDRLADSYAIPAEVIARTPRELIDRLCHALDLDPLPPARP